jgi:hypothetical protein
MESKVWDTLIEIQHLLESSFNETGTEVFEAGMDRFNQPGWVNRVWTSDAYRRAHVDVVDARESKGLWMMHCCIFPHTHNPAPIFGFDVIAGKNKTLYDETNQDYCIAVTPSILYFKFYSLFLVNYVQQGEIKQMYNEN